MKVFFLRVTLGAILGLVGLHILALKDAQAEHCSPGSLNCRNYGVTYLVDSNYTALTAKITYADPSVRDGGFTAEAIWISTGSNWIEMGWEKNASFNGGRPFFYWAYNDGTYHETNLETNTREHWYQIEHKTSDNKWHIYLDGVERGSIALPFSQGYIIAGGEVTYKTADHNAMGTGGFTRLGYMRNHTGYYQWNGWDTTTEDYDYEIIEVAHDHFQNRGYNP